MTTYGKSSILLERRCSAQFVSNDFVQSEWVYARFDELDLSVSKKGWALLIFGLALAVKDRQIATTLARIIPLISDRKH
ncbi:MAG: hypothetical protein AAF579_01100 [Cyanobacteria bacterium P01_C01_bin.118]